MAGRALATTTMLARGRAKGAGVEVAAIHSRKAGQAIAAILVAGDVPTDAKVFARTQGAGIKLVADFSEVTRHAVAVVTWFFVKYMAFSMLAYIHLAIVRSSPKTAYGASLPGFETIPPVNSEFIISPWLEFYKS
ncbi:hypothetical protein X975_03416, partial [Stegodyphus mimosarum]